MKRTCTALTTAGLLAGWLGSASAQTTIYNSIPGTIPGNVSSIGYEATSTSEFGDHVQFVPSTPRRLKSVTVLMSSWGCEAGNWFSGTCVTTPGAGFTHPITLKIYNVAAGPSAGTLIASKTVNVTIPFRPSADNLYCTGADAGKWFSVQDGKCYNGYATPITFDLVADNITVPDAVIWTVAYNTSHYGAPPLGSGAPCYSTSGGCGYDSLNVGTQTFPIIVGTDVDLDGAFLNSTWAGAYCDNGAAGTGSLRLDTGTACWYGGSAWGDFRPLATVVSFKEATAANQCKSDGWKTLTRANATPFKNQGDCMQYINTGK